MTLYRINSRLRLYSRPERSQRYLAFIRSFPCAGCGSKRKVEAAHTGPHGLGTKASDFAAIPLCRDCHRAGERSYHRLGPALFQIQRKLDIPALVRMFQGFWFLKTGERIAPEIEERKIA